MKTAILTDSGCDFDRSQLEQYSVHQLSSRVSIGVKTFDHITTEQVIQEMQANKATMLTTPPSEAEFSETFRHLLDVADEVLCVHSSADIVQTIFNSAQAAKPFGSLVQVLDSRAVSTGLGLRVIRAAQLAEQGKNAAQITAELQRVTPHASMWFTVDTLKFLQLNGRVSAASAVVGGLLNMKPTLKIEDGRIQAAGRAIGHGRAMSHLADAARAYLREHPHTCMAFFHAPGGERYVQELRSELRSASFTDMGDHLLGPTVTANTGPGTVGIAVEPAGAI